MELFAKYGIKSVTMDFIAEQLAVSKRTIYELFTDKRALLEEGVEFTGREHKMLLAQIYQESVGCIETLINAGIANHKVISSINPAFFNDLIRHYPAIYRKMNQEFMGDSARYMEAIFREGIEDGLFDRSFNPQTLGVAWQRMAEMLNRDFEGSWMTTESREMHFHLFIPFFRGICTQTGRAKFDEYLLKIKDEENL